MLSNHETSMQTRPHSRAATHREADLVWRALWRKQVPRISGRMCTPFLEGLRRARLAPDRLPRHAELSRRLEDLAGWRIQTVPGLVPPRDFFALLRDRRFPSPEWIRGRENFEYTPEPDAFHDVFGHVPQLVRPEFQEVLGELADQAHGADERELEEIERIYWFTIEFGLVREAGELRAMGAGLASSVDELTRSLSASEVRRLPFRASDARRRSFETDRPQEVYLVASSLEQLGRELGGRSSRCR